MGDRLLVAAIRRGRVETFAVEAEQPAQALRAELDQRQLGLRTVAIGLPRAAVTVKPIELPEVEGDVRQMVRFELDRHLPFPSEDAPFDVLPLPAEDQAPGARQVLVAAADRRVVDGAIRIADDARLRPVSVTVAAHNLLALVAPRRGERAVWIHHVGRNAELLLLRGRQLVLSRSVEGLDAAGLAQEIRRSLGVARWRGCDAVWVSGDAGDPAGATATPLGTLGAPVTAPPYTPRGRRLLDGGDGPPDGATQLAIAVAAAGGVRPLDLVPDGLRPRRVTRAQLLTAAMVAATVLLAITALLVPGWRQARQLAALDARIQLLEPEVRTVEELVRDLERKKGLLATLHALEAESLRPLPVVRDLTELVPADAWLTMLTLDGKGIELTGQAAAASALIPLLENSPRFQRVEFASPVTRGRDREQFRIRAAWEPGGMTAAIVASPGGRAPGAAPSALPPAAARPASARDAEDVPDLTPAVDPGTQQPHRPLAPGGGQEPPP
jgi:Tfp pilus assembly protein PilN